MKKNILSIISVLVIIYAIAMNIFFPASENKFSSSSIFPEIKESFKSEVLEHSDSEVAGLGLGYLVGEKSELPDGVEKKMKAVGLAHIIVVSGTHLSIIILASRKIFEKVSRFSALYFSLALLLVYIGLVGLSPSLLRAGFVSVLGLFAWFFGRKMKPERTVLLTLGFCLLINPYFLTNLSFQLSILAYAGIVILYPALVKYFYGRRKPNFLASTILSSLSASVACLPLQLYFFGTFNFLSILANLLIIPTIPFAMAASFFTGVFGMINLDFLAQVFGKISDFILGYHVNVINFLYEKTEFQFEVSKKNLLFLGIYFILILGVYLIFRARRKTKEDRFKRLMNLKKVNIWE